MNAKTKALATIALFLALGLAASSGLSPQTRQAPPPEYKEVAAANQLKDASARLRELERIKAAYPESQYMRAIDNLILAARIELAETLEAVLVLQNGYLTEAQGLDRLPYFWSAVAEIQNHPKLGSFDQKEVLSVILKYREEILKAAADPATWEGSTPERESSLRSMFVLGTEIYVARAHLRAGRPDKAMETLEAYKRDGGRPDGAYYHALGLVLEAGHRTNEAYEAFLSAALEKDEGAAEKAKALFVKIHGRPDGFEAALEAKSKALPFNPGPFRAPAEWKGKAVLAELFTGSECPPCVGADIAFDALIETIPAKYLAVLVYHLPIPRPDPMMNPATRARQEVYGVNSTPTVVIDGTDKSVGGGGRSSAESKYAQYKAAIAPLFAAAPAVSLKLRASLAGDMVKVSYDLDRAVPDAGYHLVLVQDEQEHKGGNGIVYHKMVVRDLITVDPAAPKSAAFDLAASEKTADAYLTEFEKSYTRVPNFRWEVRRNALPRTGLKVVFFVQEKESRTVLNAVVADVK